MHSSNFIAGTQIAMAMAMRMNMRAGASDRM
jgi:hypothetical protein